MERTLPAWRLGYRPALDGLRGVAILLVVLGHTYIPGFGSAASVGVTLFFVLSGFLITSLLIEERVQSGTIDLRAFYLRRARRLGPALGCFLLVMLLVGVGWQSILAGALYIGNFVRMTGTDMLPIGHLWSLAVEEQFYLVWPLLILLAVPRQWLLLGVVIAVIATLLTPMPAYLFATWTHLPSLALGCGLGLAYHRGFRTPWPRSCFIIGSMGLLVIGAIPLAHHPFSATALAAGLVLAGSLERGGLAWRPLMGAGKVSYAWYLWHYPLIMAVPSVVAPLTLPFSLAIAVISWRYIEQPFLRRHRPELLDHELDQRVVVA